MLRTMAIWPAVVDGMLHDSFEHYFVRIAAAWNLLRQFVDGKIPKLLFQQVATSVPIFLCQETGDCSEEVRTGCEPSPIDAPKSGDEIEVPVSAQKRKRILAAECGDPQVIGRNGLTFLFQLQANGCIGVRGVIVDVEHSHRSGPFPEPVLVAYPVPGLRDAKPVFA